MTIFNHKITIYLALFFSMLCYFIFAYFTDRQNFNLIFILYTLVFIAFIYILKLDISSTKLFQLGILFRLIFLFSTPILSQDFYRFIWDGRLIVSGINPYEFLPKQIINQVSTISQSDYLLEKMGSLSAKHFSNYPPINQLIFAMAGLFSGKSILGSAIFFRLVILFSDIGIYFFGRKILNSINQNPNQIFWYFLNPLVILELTGNLHFEGVMLFFLVLGFYKLNQDKYIEASFFITVSIAIKLLPLLLLPLFWKKIGIKNSIVFYFLIIVLSFIFFLPFVNQSLAHNYFETIALWFTNFEFNASLYYLIREVGFYVKGYNIIGIVGKFVPIITILIVLFFAFFKNNASLKNVITNSLLVLTFYFFISTTVHPWYVINLVLLSVFTKYKFPIVWSFFIILSYSAYSNIQFQENYILVFMEYFLVFIVFLVEVSGKLNCLYKFKSLQNN